VGGLAPPQDQRRDAAVSEGLACSLAPPSRPVLDRLDGRVRVLSAAAAVATILALGSPVVLALALVLGLGLALLSGLSGRDVAARLVHMEGFLLVLLVVLPLTAPGPTIALGPVALSQPGLDRAILVLLRVNLCALAILTLLAGLEPVHLGHALGRLKVPAKLVHLFLFAARYVAVIGEEAGRLHDALRVRAFRPRTSLHTLRTLAYFVGQLLVRAFERAERVDEAMRCRAFAGRFALVADARLTRHDALFAGGLAIGLAVVLLLDRLA
jgi:cobalt/nickel transport system permease protein